MINDSCLPDGNSSFSKTKIQRLKTSLSGLEENGKEWSGNVENCQYFPLKIKEIYRFFCIFVQTNYHLLTIIYHLKQWKKHSD